MANTRLTEIIDLQSRVDNLSDTEHKHLSDLIAQDLEEWSRSHVDPNLTVHVNFGYPKHGAAVIVQKTLPEQPGKYGFEHIATIRGKEDTAVETWRTKIEQKYVALRSLQRSDKELIVNLNMLRSQLGVAGKKLIMKPSGLTEVYDPSQTRLVKVGITPGDRRYEVLDSQLGRTILVFGGKEGYCVYQKGPLRRNIKANYMWDKVGESVPSRKPNGPKTRANGRDMVTKLPTICPVLKKFVDVFNADQRSWPPKEVEPKLIADLEGTFAPHLREVRLRRLANVIIELTVPEDFCKTPVQSKDVKLAVRILKANGFEGQASLLRDAYRCSELETTMKKAQGMAWVAKRLLYDNDILTMALSMRFVEIIAQ